MVEPRLRQLDHRQLEAAFALLHAAVEQLQLNRAEAGRSRRVAALLRELAEFKALLAEAKPGSTMAVHPETSAALGGRYPAPIAFDRSVESADDPTAANVEHGDFAVWGSERNNIRSVENMFAHAVARDQPAFAVRRSAKWIHQDVWAGLGIDTLSDEALLFIVPDWLIEEPSDIRNGLIRLIDARIAEVRKAFQLPEGFNAGRRTLHSFAEASAEWTLMRDVLDAVWPLERGKPNSRQIGVLNAIIDEATAFATGYPEEASDVGDQPQNSRIRMSNRASLIGNDRKSAMITYRHQLATLGSAIAALEQSLRRIGDNKNAEKPLGNGARETYLSIDALTSWKREVERRLETGDYLIHHTEALRPTGPLLWLPAFPRMRPDTNNPVFLAALCEAAQQVKSPPALRDESGRKPRRR